MEWLPKRAGPSMGIWRPLRLKTSLMVVPGNGFQSLSGARTASMRRDSQACGIRAQGVRKGMCCKVCYIDREPNLSLS